MADKNTVLTPQQIDEAGLSGWRRVEDTITARFDTGDFTTGLALVDRIGLSAEAANHHPDLTLTYPEVTVTLSSHDVGGITSRDIDLARVIDEHAEELGVSAAAD